MKIKNTKGWIIAMSDWSSSSLDKFSDDANDYLQTIKNALTEVQQHILTCEEKLKDIKVDDEYMINNRWPRFYVIHNKEVQNFWEKLNKILDFFYSKVEKGLTSKKTDQETTLIKDAIHQRKEMVRKAILEKIHSFQMNKLTKEYDNGKTKYENANDVIVNIERWEKTRINHVFNPIIDIDIVTRVGGCYGWDEYSYDVCISKDVFSPPTEEEIKNNTYLKNLLTKKEKEVTLIAKTLLRTLDES